MGKLINLYLAFQSLPVCVLDFFPPIIVEIRTEGFLVPRKIWSLGCDLEMFMKT